ncbi:hypothetical protein [Amycolatopsis sp. CA-128772]|uniref:hypothetical protein n=1 Tax=Amycolatopsis sp. CA-128772 TaxID=2073159 RepID=UPI000CD3069B|nr:hypothetical protein [Amycolatopsis sp. CA-128772]
MGASLGQESPAHHLHLVRPPSFRTPGRSQIDFQGLYDVLRDPDIGRPCLRRMIVLDFSCSGLFMAALKNRRSPSTTTLAVAATSAHRDVRAEAEWSGGLLTERLIDGLRTGAADLDQNGVVTGQGFADHLVWLAGTELQQPATYRQGSVADLEVAWNPSSPNVQATTSVVAEVAQDDPPGSDVDWRCTCRPGSPRP